MIPRRELEQLRANWTLDMRVIEKDYLLGRLLAVIVAQPLLGHACVFGGGYALPRDRKHRKRYDRNIYHAKKIFSNKSS